MAERLVKVYPRFERFWHWSQFLLIVVLLFSGTRIMGVHGVMPFGGAVLIHIIAAVALMVLWVFAIFWHLTTGTWKHYVPTRKGLWQVARFYAFDIFTGARHPYRRAYMRKHNPLQALAYLGLKLMLFPAIWGTGLVYLGYGLWDDIANAGFWLEVVANLHVLSAFAIAGFVVIHVYLLTVGGGFREHVTPMISGFAEVDLTSEEEAYLNSDEPERLRP